MPLPRWTPETSISKCDVLSRRHHGSSIYYPHLHSIPAICCQKNDPIKCDKWLPGSTTDSARVKPQKGRFLDIPVTLNVLPSTLKYRGPGEIYINPPSHSSKSINSPPSGYRHMGGLGLFAAMLRLTFAGNTEGFDVDSVPWNLPQWQQRTNVSGIPWSTTTLATASSSSSSDSNRSAHVRDWSVKQALAVKAFIDGGRLLNKDDFTKYAAQNKQDNNTEGRRLFSDWFGRIWKQSNFNEVVDNVLVQADLGPYQMVRNAKEENRYDSKTVVSYFTSNFQRSLFTD